MLRGGLKIILQQMGIVQPGEEVAGVNNVLERRRAHLRRGVHRHAGQLALAPFMCAIAAN